MQHNPAPQNPVSSYQPMCQFLCRSVKMTLYLANAIFHFFAFVGSSFGNLGLSYYMGLNLPMVY
jgi:hypothetical protein